MAKLPIDKVCCAIQYIKTLMMLTTGVCKEDP